MEPNRGPRRYEVDWLRVLAFSAVFLYHCGRFFDESDWHIKNSQTSVLVTTLKGVFDLWGMPLLFLISGASIYFALRPGNSVRFLKDKVWRLLVPLGIGILVLGPPQVYLDRLSHGRFEGGFLEFLPLYFQDWQVPGGNFAWSGVHLWYLEDLFLFTLVLMPLFAALKQPAGERLLERLGRLSARPGAIFLWALPFALLAFAADPLHLAWGALSEDLTRLAMYPPFLIFGFLVFSSELTQRAIIRQRRAALALALATTVSALVIGAWIEQGLDLWMYTLVAVLISLLIWSYVLAVLGYGMRYLTANSRLLAYANEAVLPVYILHQPLILIVGFFVVPLALPILAKYLIIAPLAIGITLGLYEYGIRRTNLVRRLFGLKPQRSALPKAALSGWPSP
jgi:glucan biosynthesis protein C